MTESMKLSKKFWWKLYLWLMVALVIGAALSEPYSEESLEAPDIIDYGTWLFSLVGVFGFAYSRAFLRRRLWQAWLPIVVVLDVGLLVKQYAEDTTELDPQFIVFLVVFFVIIVVPQYVALYLYGYGSNSLWSAKA